jgi:hypothetical protein
MGAVDQEDARAWLECARRGDLGTAWAFSDRILERRAGKQDWRAPRHLQQIWDGTALDGKRVLIRCYHGLGDTIQFIRYAPLVRAVAREVIVWAQPALMPLLATAAGIDRLLPLHDGTPDVDYDVDVEIMELAHVFRTTLSTIPAAVPYLHAEPLPLPAASLPRVGVFWRAGDWDTRRSIPFAIVERLFECSHVRWYLLQDSVKEDEQHWNASPLDTAGLMRTARIMTALDLVISIDSMPAHLAGALAVPVWTLLPSEADWRWMERRADSPWYPTMRLFRQPSPGRWDAVLEEVRAVLPQMRPESPPMNLPDRR